MGAHRVAFRDTGRKRARQAELRYPRPATAPGSPRCTHGAGILFLSADRATPFSFALAGGWHCASGSHAAFLTKAGGRP
jgi:hypothetical protein